MHVYMRGNGRGGKLLHWSIFFHLKALCPQLNRWRENVEVCVSSLQSTSSLAFCIIVTKRVDSTVLATPFTTCGYIYVYIYIYVLQYFYDRKHTSYSNLDFHTFTVHKLQPTEKYKDTKSVQLNLFFFPRHHFQARALYGLNKTNAATYAEVRCFKRHTGQNDYNKLKEC